MHRRKSISWWQYIYFFIIALVAALNTKIAWDSFSNGDLMWGVNSIVIILLFVCFGVLNLFVVESEQHFVTYLGYGLASVSLLSVVSAWFFG